jgi:hypothetical protein
MNTTEHSIFVSQFGMGAAEEIQAWICEHDGHPFIELRLHKHTTPGEAPLPDTVIPIPATLLPELKRLVQGLEEQMIAQGLSDEFQTVEQLHLDRGPMFAHPSEAEFAQMLDFYKIRWQYEPTTFALQSDAQGRILESFTPDFYLQDQDLYIELTTQKQGLVTKKNRKVRLLKQRYPGVNIKLFYRRDVERLRQKYSGPNAQKNPGNLLTS